MWCLLECEETHELQKKTQQLELGEEKLKSLTTTLKEYEEKCQLQEERLHQCGYYR